MDASYIHDNSNLQGVDQMKITILMLFLMLGSFLAGMELIDDN